MLNTVTLNLLPWRKTQQEKKQNKYIAFLIFAIFFLIIIGTLISYRYVYLIENSVRKNVFFELYLDAILKVENDANELNEKLTTIQSVLNKQNNTLRFFEKIALAVPEKIYLTKASLQKEQIVLAGYAESTKPISDFMTQLIELNVIKQPSLNIFDIKKDNYFEISMQWHFKE